MATNSDLPIDLVEEEILSRLPLLSLGKKWDALCKTPMVFGKAKAAARKKQFVGFMVMDYRVCSLKLDLQGIRNDSVDLSVKQVSILDQIEISQEVFHCDGLLLSVFHYVAGSYSHR